MGEFSVVNGIAPYGGPAATTMSASNAGYLPASGQQFKLVVQLDDSLWDTLKWRESDNFLKAAQEFLQRNKKNLVFSTGLVSKMEEMVSSGAIQGDADIAMLL